MSLSRRGGRYFCVSYLLALTLVTDVLSVAFLSCQTLTCMDVPVSPDVFLIIPAEESCCFSVGFKLTLPAAYYNLQSAGT